MKLTLSDIQTLLLDVSVAVSDLKMNGTKDIIVKEKTVLVKAPQVKTKFYFEKVFQIYYKTNIIRIFCLFSSQFKYFQYPEDRMHFSIILPKKENGRPSVCSTNAEIGSLSESDGNAELTADHDDSIDHDEYLADLIARLLKRFKPLRANAN